MPNPFGTDVRARRIQRRLTLEKVRKVVKVSHRGYVSGWETGACPPPTPGILRRLARLLGVPAPYLLALAHAVKAPKEVREQFLSMAEALSPERNADVPK